MKLSMSVKILIYYLALLILSMVLSSLLYQRAFLGITADRVKDISIQMLYSISESINTIVDIVGDYSKLIISNEVIQDSLRNASPDISFDRQLKADLAISTIIGGCPYIESVYIFDYNGNRFCVDKNAIKPLVIPSIKDAAWHSEVVGNKGKYILALNSGDVLQRAPGQENSISLIRQINNMHTQMPLGVIIVNISQRSVIKAFEGITGNYETEVAILDDKGNYVVDARNNTGFDISSFVKASHGLVSNYTLWKADHIEYFITYLRNEKNGWKYVSIIPFRELSKELGIFSFITFVVIAVNGVFLFIGLMIISRLVTVPIKKLLKSMKGIAEGEFKKVDIKTANDEIGKLKDGFNTMVDEIQSLISRIIREQKMKRKMELDALQAQIKPHFLYNTFDAISYLALTGKNKDVYIIMKALGNYYRTSLSKGSEVITIGEEIDMAENYLKIQKYRYEDAFTAVFRIDEKARKYKILKLVLQPFVENALYHGIKPKNGRGTIIVSAECNDDFILLQVSDDGVGMGTEQIAKIMDGNAAAGESGFGIRGTIERLRIFYGIEDIVSIESREGFGTTVSVKIPARGAACS